MPIGQYDTEEYCPSVETIYAEAAKLRANDTPDQTEARLRGKIEETVGLRNPRRHPAEERYGRAALQTFATHRRRGGLHSRG